MLSSIINLVRSSTYKAIKNVLTFANLTPLPGGYHTKPVITTFQIQIFNRNDGISFQVTGFPFKGNFIRNFCTCRVLLVSAVRPTWQSKQNNSNSVRRNSMFVVYMPRSHSWTNYKQPYKTLHNSPAMVFKAPKTIRWAIVKSTQLPLWTRSVSAVRHMQPSKL